MKNRIEIRDPRALIDEEFAATFLGLAPRTLQGWRQKGYGPKYIKISRRAVRYRICDLMSWVENQMGFSSGEETL